MYTDKRKLSRKKNMLCWRIMMGAVETQRAKWRYDMYMGNASMYIGTQIYIYIYFE